MSVVGTAVALKVAIPVALRLNRSPALPELKTRPVAPVVLPRVMVWAMALVPMLRFPVPSFMVTAVPPVPLPRVMAVAVAVEARFRVVAFWAMLTVPAPVVSRVAVPVPLA
jgi:hypothetical protein